MIDLEVVSEFMYAHFEQVRPSRHGTHFLARCPLCGDSKKNPFKKRFNLDYNNGVPGWNCFNCDEHGNFYDIYSRMLGISYDDAVDRLNNEKWDRNRIKKRLDKKERKKKITELSYFNWILEDCMNPPERYINALNKFRESRKIPNGCKLYIAYKGKYRNRIIIPVIDKEDNIVYFQGRRIPGTKLLPKYDNPASPKEIVILNSHLFDPDKYIIVPEGIIDAWMIGTQGTSCLGKYISGDFVEKLFAMTSKGVIIALDNDDEGRKALKKFMDENKFSRKVKYFFHPSEFAGYDDINSFVRNNDIPDVYSLIVNNIVNYSTAVLKLKKIL